MYEPISLVKVRKDTKITVPAGGWVILCDPNTPLHQHLAERKKLAESPLNEDFSEFIIGRIQDVSPKMKFVTADEQKAIEKKLASDNKAFFNASREAVERQAKMEAEAKKIADDEHRKKVEALNKTHDLVRNK